MSSVCCRLALSLWFLVDTDPEATPCLAYVDRPPADATFQRPPCATDREMQRLIRVIRLWAGGAGTGYRFVGCGRSVA